MNKFEVELGLEKVAEARKEWNARRREFDEAANYTVNRLIHEAVVNYMSPSDIARHLGVTRTRVIRLLHDAGMRTSMGKRALSDYAAKALSTNSALLGIEPHEMDLMSPLAYLPMGSQMKRFLETPVDVEEALDETPLSEAGRHIRQVAALGSPTSAPWSFTPCCQEHEPGRLCILPDGHNRPLPASDSL